MAVITELSRDLLDDSVRQFGVGDVVDFWPAADGIENTNYFVRTDNTTEFVLTVVESGELLSDVMLAILDTAEAAGLPVAPPLRSDVGVSYTSRPRVARTRSAIARASRATGG